MSHWVLASCGACREQSYRLKPCPDPQVGDRRSKNIICGAASRHCGDDVVCSGRRGLP